MKKILALILAVMMIASLSLTAFAAVDQDSSNKSGATKVFFEVNPTYIVTIPETVSLQMAQNGTEVTYENDYEITAEAGVRLKKGYCIEVAVITDNVMETEEGATLTYEITKDGAALENNVVAVFGTDKEAQVSKIHISAGDPDYAGTYEDTVTFTVAVKVALISFTLRGKTYQAEAGMTLCQWAESPYDVDDEYHDAGDGSIECAYGFAFDEVIVDGKAYSILD